MAADLPCRVLLVGGDELRPALSSSHWEVVAASSVEQACFILDAHPCEVVVTSAQPGERRAVRPGARGPAGWLGGAADRRQQAALRRGGPVRTGRLPGALAAGGARGGGEGEPPFGPGAGRPGARGAAGGARPLRRGQR